MISSERPHVPLTPDMFQMFRDMMYEHCGVCLDEQSKFFVEGRLQDRLRHHNFTTFKDFYYFLKYDPRRMEEMVIVVDLLTVHETYFFREGHQLDALKKEIIPELVAKRRDSTLRIWSAGSSTGEEAYTVAMLLADDPALSEVRVEIVGSDISQRVLEVARRGVYPASAFRTTPPEYRSRYFHPDGDGFRVDDAIRRMVSFFSFNLSEVDRASVLPKMDVILCRNVIIYFDLAVKKRVVEMFATRLRPGGYLLLGHSESLVNVSTSFNLRHLRHDMVYQTDERLRTAA